ncbi:uncharacterized protein LOC103575519 [Microplitis demolitor]|uniref:uncharacterized protein LOC103575519 n=1 Tax=Microplitis demolitor TaxID=69319 RepID=UPI0004CCC583|nr:uncharacterized protein LOC103575519 [Microplitis demolitor]
MESFKSFVNVIDAFNLNADFVKIFPIELTQMIFNKLDPWSLLIAAKVSRKWRSVCESDSQLRKTAREYLRKRKQRLFNIKPNRIFEIRACNRESRSRPFVCYLTNTCVGKRKRSASLDDRLNNAAKRLKRSISKLR